MKKKIDVIDLERGMYVSELDRPWLETPFLFQGFELRQPEEFELIRKFCKYVFIDVARGPDISPQRRRAAEQRTQALKSEDVRITRKVHELAESAASILKIREISPVKRPAYQDQVVLEQEIVQAREIETKTRVMVDTALDDAAKGKNVDTQLAMSAVTRMVDSVLRNPDALVCLTQLKELSEYTALHSIRSCIIGIAFARHLVMTREEMIALGMGLLLHDIGTVKVPKEIMVKPTGLSLAEFDIMKKHVQWGMEILDKSGDMPPLGMQVVQGHHERRDGAGYPMHLEGDAIKMAGYIGSIVDVYDAITSDRMYAGGLSAEDALKRMYEWRERDFHPQLVEEFIKCMGIFPIGSLVELNNGSIGVVITVNRARRLKPKVALVLTATKQPYSQKIIVDLAEHKDILGQEIKITRVLPTGTHGIHPMEHIVRL